MDEKTELLQRAGDTVALVATASQAQAAKVREIMGRLDRIVEIDPKRIENITAVLNAAKADGGCGIGCW